MTYTELFHDFLKREGLMKAFVDAYNSNKSRYALDVTNRLPIKWTDDFLVKETEAFRVERRYKQFMFLWSKIVIDWRETKEGYDFWRDICRRWEKFAKSEFAKRLIDDPYLIK